MAIVFVNNSVVNSAGESKVKRRSKKSSVKASMDPRIKSGRWTDAERRIFLKGLKQLWVAYIYYFLNVYVYKYIAHALFFDCFFLLLRYLQ